MTVLNNLLLLGRDDDIVKHEGQTALVCLAVTEVLDAIEELARTCHTHTLDDAGDDFLQRLLTDDLIDEAYLFWNNIVDDDTTNGGLDDVLDGVAICINILDQTLNLGVYVHLALVVGDDGLFWAIEGETFALCTWTNLGNIVETEHHVLRRNGDRFATGRREDVVRLKHEQLSLQDCLVGKWKVNSHLVTIEVGVERCTCEWVELDSLTFNHAWLECLDT